MRKIKLISSLKNFSITDEDPVVFLNTENKWLSVESERDFQESGGQISKSNFLESDSNIFSMSCLENNGTLVRKNIIELNRYTGFVKREFRISIETIYRTGTCKVSK